MLEPYIADQKFRMLAPLDNIESVIWIERYCDYGEFELYIADIASVMPYAKVGYYVLSNESETVMILERIRIESDPESGDHLILSGRSLESILTRRILWEKTVFNGTVEECIKKILNENFIAPKLDSRKIPNLTWLNPSEVLPNKELIKQEMSYDECGEVIIDFCKMENIGFRMRLTEDNQFTFQLYQGKDRTYDQNKNPYVIFSDEFENLDTNNYEENAEDFRNTALVLGEGEDENRIKIIVFNKDSEISGLERREMQVDARDLQSNLEEEVLTEEQYVNLLVNRGRERLKEWKVDTTFDSQVETTHSFFYQKDYFLGDIVEFKNHYGVSKKCRVIEYIRNETASEVSAYPTFEALEE